MTRNIEVKEALDVGNDVLVVRGTVNGVETEARGWVSALENHRPPEAYAKDGSLKEKQSGEPIVEPRSMTKAERRAYCERLLDAALPEVKPIDI